MQKPLAVSRVISHHKMQMFLLSVPSYDSLNRHLESASTTCIFRTSPRSSSSGSALPSRTSSTVSAGPVVLSPDPLDALASAEALASVELLGPVDPLELLDSLGPVDPLELLESLDPLDPLELLESLDPLELLESLDPADPLELLDPLSVPVAEIGVSPPSISQLNLPDVTSDCIAFNSFNIFSVFNGIFLHATSWILMCLSINGNSSANVVPGSAKLARNSAACFSNALSFASRALINSFNPSRYCLNGMRCSTSNTL